MSTKREPFQARRRALRKLVEEVVAELATDPETPVSITLPATDVACLHDVAELPRSLQPKFLQYLTIRAQHNELLPPNCTFETLRGELSLRELHAELDRLNGFSEK